jgi:hypothetical protein
MFGSADRDAAKAKEGGNQSDDEEDDGVLKHDRTSCNRGRISAPKAKYPRTGRVLQSEGVVGLCRTRLTPAGLGRGNFCDNSTG